MRASSIAAVAALAVSLLAAPASARDEPRCEEVRPGLIRCTETRIVGRRPTSFYVIGRSAIRNPPTPLPRPHLAREVARSARRL